MLGLHVCATVAWMLGYTHVPPWPTSVVLTIRPGPHASQLSHFFRSHYICIWKTHILTKHEKYCLKKCLRKHCCGARSLTAVTIDPSEWDQGSWRKIPLNFNLTMTSDYVYHVTQQNCTGRQVSSSWMASIRACTLLSEEWSLRKAGCDWFKEAPVHLKKQGKENRNQITSTLWWWNLRGSWCVDENLTSPMFGRAMRFIPKLRWEIEKQECNTRVTFEGFGKCLVRKVHVLQVWGPEFDSPEPFVLGV